MAMNAILSAPVLKEREFRQFSSFIYDKVGITLPLGKKTMLEARLHKRLKALSMGSFEDYARFVFSREGQEAELVHLIDVVTTNKTDFFRESNHFDYLTSTVLPEIIARRGGGMRDPIRFWSAGCSSGEEPYTLAMVLSDQAEKRRDFTFSIFASDISTRILDKAMKGIYTEVQVEPVPESFKKKYLLRSKDRSSPLVRVSPDLRALITFRRVNFMDNDLGLRQHMDVIFCRNVVIYFDKPTQQAVMRKFHRQLKPEGYLFLGHSESLSGLEVDFQSVASTVYRRG